MSSSSSSRAAPLAVFCAVVFASCAVHHSPKPSSTATEAAVPPPPVETRVGVVRAIGPEQRFVLVETPSALAATALVEGQSLHSRPPDSLTRVATADLRVSREHHQALVVANVIAGEPVVGAIVYTTLRPPPAASPAPGSISSVVTAPLSNPGNPRQP